MTKSDDDTILIEKTEDGKYRVQLVGLKLRGEDSDSMALVLKALIGADILDVLRLGRMHGYVFAKVDEKTPVTAAELIGLLAFIHEVNEWREVTTRQYRSPPTLRLDISDCDLEEVDLSPEGLKQLDCPQGIQSSAGGIDLSGALLAGTILIKAKLKAARLERAQLQRSNLIGANLQDVNLSAAKLQHALPSGADLRNANLFGGKSLRRRHARFRPSWC